MYDNKWSIYCTLNTVKMQYSSVLQESVKYLKIKTTLKSGV